MAKVIGVLHLCLLLFATLFVQGQEAAQIKIIYDNFQADDRLDTDWGFAGLVENKEKKLLFDAGRNADLYQKNMGILNINPSVNCYLPSGYAAQLKAS